jgi:integrase
MADTRYLKKRRQTWYFVIKVPVDVQPALGRKEIVRTLGTRDLSKAQRDRWPLVTEWMARFEVERGNRQWTPAEIEAQAGSEFRRLLGTFEETNTDVDALEVFVDLEGEKLSDEAPPLPDLDYALTSARIQAAQGRINALHGEPFEPRQFSRKIVDPITLKAVPVVKRPNGEPFAEVSRKYLDEVQRDPASKLTQQTKGQYEAVYRLFDQWAERPHLGDVTKKRASEFLEAVGKLDPNWGRSPETKKRTYAEIAEAFGSTGRGLTNRTVNRYATALSLVWQWAKRRGHFSGENPWVEQYRSVSKTRAGAKAPFTPEELRTLLAAAPEVKPDEHSTKNTLRWLALISAYSGMRLNEMCDRRVSDLRQEDGVWYFDIVNAKTEAGDRRVPLHSKVIAAGLLDFAKHGDEWLFPNLKPGGPDKKRSWYISKRFTAYRRGLGVVRVNDRTDRDRLDFHSFRRSAVRALELARVPQTEAAQVVGHDREGITFGIYNPEGLGVRALQDVVEKIRYPGL